MVWILNVVLCEELSESSDFVLLCLALALQCTSGLLVHRQDSSHALNDFLQVSIGRHCCSYLLAFLGQALFAIVLKNVAILVNSTGRVHVCFGAAVRLCQGDLLPLSGP